MTSAFFYVLLAVVAAAPFITFGALLGTGRNWVRVLLTVLLSVGGFISLIALLTPYSEADALLRVIALMLLGISVAVITLLFSSAANRFFAGPR